MTASSVSPKLHLSLDPDLDLDRGKTKKNSKKKTFPRRPRRGQGGLPLARAHRPRQVEGGAHRVCGSGRLGHRDLLGGQDLWRGEEGGKGPRRRRRRCGAGKVKKSEQKKTFSTGKGEKSPDEAALLLVSPFLCYLDKVGLSNFYFVCGGKKRLSFFLSFSFSLPLSLFLFLFLSSLSLPFPPSLVSLSKPTNETKKNQKHPPTRCRRCQSRRGRSSPRRPSRRPRRRPRRQTRASTRRRGACGARPRTSAGRGSSREL